jgi:hypothetical protein
MDPEPKPGVEGVAPERSGTAQPVRRRSRGGRGRRSRGPRVPRTPVEPLPPPSAETAEPIQPVAEATPVEQETPPPQFREPRPEQQTAFREPRPAQQMPERERRPAEPMAVQEAIEEVNQIIEALRSTLNDMEDVLETLELAERQKIADEQEIETLRRGLRQLHRPPDRGPHPPRH